MRESSLQNSFLETPHKAVRGDVRDRASVLEVVRETDVVVHAAALHGIHLEKYTTDDFWDLNVVGTCNVYEAARELGIGKILLCSTMGVYGEGVRESGDPPVITEDLSLQPSDFYGFSKRMYEEIAAFYYRRHGIWTIAYRLGMFVLESFVGYGFRLPKGGVDDRDVAQAFLLGLDDTSITFDAFNVMAEVPFCREGSASGAENPRASLRSGTQASPGWSRSKGQTSGSWCGCGDLLTGPSRRPKAYSGTGLATTSPSSSRHSREGIGHTTPTRTSRGGASSAAGAARSSSLMLRQIPEPGIEPLWNAIQLKEGMH